MLHLSYHFRTCINITYALIYGLLNTICSGVWILCMFRVFQLLYFSQIKRFNYQTFREFSFGSPKMTSYEMWRGTHTSSRVWGVQGGLKPGNTPVRRAPSTTPGPTSSQPANSTQETCTSQQLSMDQERAANKSQGTNSGQVHSSSKSLGTVISNQQTGNSQGNNMGMDQETAAAKSPGTNSGQVPSSSKSLGTVNSNQQIGNSQGSSKTYQQVKYSFFSKPMGTEYVMMGNSAASYQSKKATLSQGVITRLMTTSVDLDTETKVGILETFYDIIMSSGYSKNQAHEILESNIVGYNRKVKKG